MDCQREYQGPSLEDQYRNLLTGLTGVLSAKVVLDELQNIREIYVLADADHSEKQIMRDVRSALNSLFDVDVDHRAISVARMKDDFGEPQRADSAERRNSTYRLKCDRISQSLEGDSYAVTITLKRGNQIYDGSCSSHNTEPRRMACIANAVINAVHNFLGHDALFRVVSVKRIASLPVSVCMVLVEYIGGGGSQMLVGATQIGADEAVSVEYATMDAINRKIQSLVEP